MIVFHRALISTAILFLLVFAIWEWSAYRATAGTLSLVLAVGSLVASLALAYYLKNLRRFLGR